MTLRSCFLFAFGSYLVKACNIIEMGVNVMKVAVMSDIHANMVAFNWALSDVKKEDVDEYVFLGDYITDGEDSGLVLEKIRELSSYVIRGNR